MKWRVATAMATAPLLVGILAGCSSLPKKASGPPSRPVPFGSIWVDSPRRELVVSGYVNQVSGPIELLACGTGGKTHESVLVLYAKPHDLQAGLLLLGLRHGTPMPGLGAGPPSGDPVHLDVQWETEGVWHHAPAENFVLDTQTGRRLRHGGWIFNGSMFEQGQFKASAEESMVATYWDPWAIINLKANAGADDDRLVVNRDMVPSLHTPIRLVIRAGRK